jgi:hypothetical protein
MDEVSFFDWWYSVEQYVVQKIAMVPPREGERSWSGGGREGGSHGCRFRPVGCLFLPCMLQPVRC